MIGFRKNKQNLVSVIIPSFRQEKTIVQDVFRIEGVLKQIRQNFEMIVVVDGMVDKTYERLRKIKSTNIKIVGYEKNKGKGYAIRYGMVRTEGNIVGFIDSGMELHPSGLAILLEHFEWHNADIIVGSKRHPASKIKYPTDRRIISYLSQVFIRLLFGLNVRDTQVGMKFFKRKVIEDVLPRLLVKKFAFDIEILTIAYHLGYKRIFEAPVELNYNFKGSLISQGLLNAIAKTLWDTLAIFYRLKIIRYYDNSSRRRWKYDPELNFRVNIG